MPNPAPIMRVVAGPPGAGKSTAFPVALAGFDYFDADQRAVNLNGGSFSGIPNSIRTQVNHEFEAFIDQHIADRASFTFETTLRSGITLDQARRAREAGFVVTMTYVALKSVELHIERVALRADRGGHSAPVRKITEIYRLSLENLKRALLDFDEVAVFDNSGPEPELVLVFRHGVATYSRESLPEWVRVAVNLER